MKLLNKTTIYTSITTLILLLAGISIVYFLILKKFDHEDNEHLLMDKNKVVNLLLQGKAPVLFLANVGEKVSVVNIPAQTIKGNVFRDYTIAEEGEEDDDDEQLTFRELRFQTKINNAFYEIKISHSLSEGKEIAEYITSTIILFLIFSLAVLFALNMMISKRIWSPFYNTLAKLKGWTIKENSPLHFKQTNINEFNELNTTVNALIKKIKEDYTNLKEFTENISHETQTPLAIISAKIEMLMQESNYSEKQQTLLSQSYQAIQRLKKLNETLVTLTRIENNQFIGTEKIDLSLAVKNKVADLIDFIEAKKITIQMDLIPVEKNINPILLNILLNNLFSNSIKHNLPENGSIHVVLNEGRLSIKNSAPNNKIDEKHLFERFKSYSTSEDSIGLGLSIIKKITDILKWKISYSHNDTIHEFEVRWG